MQPDSTVHWNLYPALLLAGCFAGGIALAAWLPGVGFWAWTGGGTAGLAFAAGNLRPAPHRLVTPRPLLRTFAVGLAVMAGGGALYTFHQLQPASHIAHQVHLLAGHQPVWLEGRIADDPVSQRQGLRFTLSLERCIAAGDTFAATGHVLATLAQPRWKAAQPYPRVAQGDRVGLYGRLRPVPQRRNPADFDYGSYLRRRGIHAMVAVYDTSAVAMLGRRPGWSGRTITPLRHYVRTQVSRHVPTEQGRRVLAALILGERSQLDADTRTRFARTGLMHLLAVSGLHVLLVGMVLYGLLRPSLMRLRMSWRTVEATRVSVTMLLLLTYLLLTGARASVVRAVVMAGLFMGGGLLQRSAHPLNTLGVAALILLLARPAHLFDVGFQLSFAAVGAIVALNPVVGRLRPRHGRLQHLLDMATTSLTATLGTMPVLLYHFGQVSFAGLVLNLAAIPCTMLALAGGLAAVTLGPWPTPASALGAAADALARLLLWIAEHGDALLGWAALRAPVPGPGSILAMVAALVMLAQWARPRLRWRWLTVALLLAVVEVWAPALKGTYRPRLEVLFFDVGQGDAALLSLPNGRHLLVDTGPRDAFTDQGSRTILPHLKRHGIRHLDAVVITHPHSDHLGGLPALLRALPIHRVIHNGENFSSALYAETVHLLDSLGVAQQAVRSGDTLDLDPSVRVQVLSPDAAAGAPANANDASVVLRVAFGHTAVLFTGDAEAGAERQMLHRYGALLKSDVIKVGHHGSGTSSTLPFVHGVLPEPTAPLAVVSVARSNPFRLPRREVLVRWQDRGAAVVTTAAEGAVWVRSDGIRIRRVRWR